MIKTEKHTTTLDKKPEQEYCRNCENVKVETIIKRTCNLNNVLRNETDTCMWSGTPSKFKRSEVTETNPCYILCDSCQRTECAIAKKYLKNEPKKEQWNKIYIKNEPVDDGNLTKSEREYVELVQQIEILFHQIETYNRAFTLINSFCQDTISFCQDTIDCPLASEAKGLARQLKSFIPKESLEKRNPK